MHFNNNFGKDSLKNPLCLIMSVSLNWFRLLSARLFVRRASSSVFPVAGLRGLNARRSFADKPKPNADGKQGHLVKYVGPQVQGTEDEERLRVRRARPTDVPRVLRFVRDNSRANWPGGALTSPYGSQIMLCDYVSRALSQGHSMLAEQQESRRSWSHIRGMAIAAVVCPWDAAVLEKFARCIKCSRSRKLMTFTSHCLRAPALHEKYRVHNILQVILIIPSNAPKNTELVKVLANNVIQRGRDVGFPLLRFDVTNEDVAKALEELNLKKEWQLSYDIVPESLKDKEDCTSPDDYTEDTMRDNSDDRKGRFIAVYTAFTKDRDSKKP